MEQDAKVATSVSTVIDTSGTQKHQKINTHALYVDSKEQTRYHRIEAHIATLLEEEANMMTYKEKLTFGW